MGRKRMPAFPCRPLTAFLSRLLEQARSPRRSLHLKVHRKGLDIFFRSDKYVSTYFLLSLLCPPSQHPTSEGSR